MVKTRKSVTNVLYTWFIIIVGFGILFGLSAPLLKSADLWREYIFFVILGILAEWFVISLPHGNISIGFVLVSSSFLIYNTGATAWISALSALISHGLISKESHLRTTLFNTAQYVISAYLAGYFYILMGGSVTNKISMANLPFILAFVGIYFVVNHILVNIYLSPQLKGFNFSIWKYCLKWDAFTFVFAIPLSILVALFYKQTGIWSVFLIFIPVLSLNYLLKLYINLEMANKDLSALYQVAKSLGISLDLTKTLNLILSETKKIFRYHTAVIYLLDEDNKTLLPTAYKSPYESEIKNSKLKLGEGIIGSVAISGEAIVVMDTKTDQRVDEQKGIKRFLRSMLIVPLSVDRQVIGVVVLGKKNLAGFNEQQLQVLTILGGQAGVAIANARLYKKLEKTATTDSLTGLYNHRFFCERIYEEYERCWRYKKDFSLLILDVDFFKKVNDTYGHLAGDKVLITIAEVIRNTVRKVDIPARYGGEEFAVLLPETNKESGLIIADRIRQNICNMAIDLENGYPPLNITVSIGLACYPYDADEIKVLIERADKALYQAKADGKNRVCIYNNEDFVNCNSFIKQNLNDSQTLGSNSLNQDLSGSYINTVNSIMENDNLNNRSFDNGSLYSNSLIIEENPNNEMLINTDKLIK